MLVIRNLSDSITRKESRDESNNFNPFHRLYFPAVKTINGNIFKNKVRQFMQNWKFSRFHIALKISCS